MEGSDQQGSLATEAPPEPAPSRVPHVTIVADGSVHGSARGGGQYHRYAEAMARERDLEDSSMGLNGHQLQQLADSSAKSSKLESEGAGGGNKGGGSGGCVQQGSGGAFEHATVLIEEPRDADYFSWSAYWGSYFKKWKGGLDQSLPRPTVADLFWSWLGAFLGILAVSALNQWVTPEIDIALMVGSFGASAVLVFGMLESKLAQPRNFVGGQLISAVIGVTVRVIILKPWIAAPVAMSLALFAMQLTRTTHPPGGATALIAASMTELPRWHGYSYLVTISLGTVVMQLIALVVNNLAPHRRYPTFWY